MGIPPAALTLRFDRTDEKRQLRFLDLPLGLQASVHAGAAVGLSPAQLFPVLHFFPF